MNAKEFQVVNEMKDQHFKLRNTLKRLMMSMRVHPDCTEGSEFDDFVNLAESVLDETADLKTLKK